MRVGDNSMKFIDKIEDSSRMTKSITTL